MSIDPEGIGSGEMSNNDVFSIFDRASAHKPNTACAYFIGDGIVARVGWVNNAEAASDLTLELRDEKLQVGVSFKVQPEVALYVRESKSLSWQDWLAADRETRRRARQFDRVEHFSMPTAALAPIAQSVAAHEPHSQLESSLSVEPLPTTDLPFIRELIGAWSKGLDDGLQI